MILVDSSVWIDYFRGAVSIQTERLDALLGRQPLAIGDLILTEVLQGIGDDDEFAAVRKALAPLQLIPIAGQDLAIQAAQNYRRLRKQGVTIRKTIDCLIATRCIENRLTLLHNDRDFEPFVTHLGLLSVF